MFTITPIKGGFSNIDGFFTNGYSCGLKPNDGKDVGFIYSDTLCDVSNVFTTNKFQAAPLKHFEQYPKDFQTNFVLINSKNANAMTGQKGIDDINTIFKKAKDKFSQIQNPIMSSTGVIGSFLPIDKISSVFEKIDLTSCESENTAKSIMTTDSYEKHITYEVKLEDGSKFHIGAICKGAGMINPAMATMLCFIVTDANIPKADMDELLTKNTNKTFNAISVDGDTSTNDTVLLLANKKSNAYNKEAFDMALHDTMQNMALKILKDGEGSNKVVAFEVLGAKDNNEAEIISKALSNSLLVKTALFGEDPNWGRIASTIGASGASCDEMTLTIKYDNIEVYKNGQNLFDEETEAKASKVMQQDQFKVICDLGIGDGQFVSFGCDLSYEYVKINADYRT
jgi:glutamate N-acetyltransferase/amino-acid N-acetyltransferase